MKYFYRTGWGRQLGARIALMDIENFHIRAQFIENICGLPVGLGRSYGDTSLNALGISWSTATLKHIEIDRIGMVAICGAGVTIGELERASLAQGLFPKVVPGTEFVTIGGAIASNIHGKTHQRFGSFGDQVIQMSLLDSNGDVHSLTPQGPNKMLFWATLGGLGLTGIVTSAVISLVGVETAYVVAEEVRVKSLAHMLQTLEEFDKEYLYTVAWIDLSGNFIGRGIVAGANPAKLSEIPEKYKSKPLIGKKPAELLIINVFPNYFINSWTVAVFNFFWFHKPLKKGIQHLQPFLHPLDSVRNWNSVYGRKGFIQYQVQIPLGSEDYLATLLHELREVGGVSFLGVLKRFGQSECKYLSFANTGWTLAVDIAASNKRLNDSLDKLDRKLIEVGGRVYLTKDSRLSKESFQAMYPEFAEWFSVKREIDPDNYWQSDQSRRLGLC